MPYFKVVKVDRHHIYGIDEMGQEYEWVANTLQSVKAATIFQGQIIATDGYRVISTDGQTEVDITEGFRKL